jgi:hypothetical protein
VSTAGQKKGIFGLDRAKTGQRGCAVARLPPHCSSIRASANLGQWRRRVRASAIDVMSLPGADRLSRFPMRPFDQAALGYFDHDFVIDAP